MLKALRISIGDITYDSVDLIDYQRMDELGYPCIFEKQSLMFRYQKDWYMSHAYNLKIIHINNTTKSTTLGIPFSRIVVDSDKVYGPGKLVQRHELADLGIPIFWENGFETQLGFVCKDGLFVTTDFAIDAVQFPRNSEWSERTATRPGRSGPRVKK